MSERVVVGMGEFAVSDREDATLVTHALGSCVAVCLWDPEARVAGMLRFVLPEARIDPERAQGQPGAFADTGIARLLEAARQRGADLERCEVKLLGGMSSPAVGRAGPDMGKRNAMAARRLLWQSGVMVSTEAIGGSTPYTAALSVADGRLQVIRGRNLVQEL